MALSIKPKFNSAQIKKVLQDKVDRINKAVFDEFQIVGETFVANARQNHTYTDRTGNLTSSIGYVILKDGVEQLSNFTGRAEGKSKGIQVAEDAGKKFLKGWVLIVVSGMQYAAAVESKNKDVLTASSITAEGDLKKVVEKLQKAL